MHARSRSPSFRSSKVCSSSLPLVLLNPALLTNSPSAPATARGVNQAKRQNAGPSVFSAFSPVKHSPPAPSLASAAAKENAGLPATKAARTTRKPLGPRAPTPPTSPMHEDELRPQASKENAHREKENTKDRRRSQILRDVTSARKQDENMLSSSVSMNTKRSERGLKAKTSEIKEGAKAADTSGGSVRNRMKEWERERERLKEMERVQERVREVEEERERDREEREREEQAREAEWERARQASFERQRERSQTQEREREFFLPKISVGPPLSPTGSAMPMSPLSPLFEEPSQLVESPVDLYPSAHTAGNESGISVLKQSLRMSMSGAVRLYKSSTQLLGRSTPALTLGSDNVDDEEESRSMSLSARASWEDEELVAKGESASTCHDAARTRLWLTRGCDVVAKSSLPTVRHAVRTEQLAAENRLDRMTIWIQNVESELSVFIRPACC